MFWLVLCTVFSLYLFPSNFWWFTIITINVLFIFKRVILEKIVVDDIKNKHVFVTGCDSGFGHMLALKLVENGIPTFAGCYTEEGKIELEKKTEWAPGKVYLVSLDVTSDKSVSKAKEFVQEKLKNRGLWGLVCNAGVCNSNAPDDWLNVDDYKKAVDVNTYGVIRTCHAFKPLIKKEKGRIVIMCSVLGRIAAHSIGPYVVSKFAVEGYADVLRLESKQFGYSVHILEPGFFVTALTSSDAVGKVYENLWNRLDEETKEEYGRDFCDKAKKCIVKNLKLVSSNNTSDVVDAYYNALTSSFPRSRYHIGLDAILLFIPLSLYPTAVQDFFMSIIEKVKGFPIPAVCRKK